MTKSLLLLTLAACSTPPPDPVCDGSIIDTLPSDQVSSLGFSGNDVAALLSSTYTGIAEGRDDTFTVAVDLTTSATTEDQVDILSMNDPILGCPTGQAMKLRLQVTTEGVIDDMSVRDVDSVVILVGGLEGLRKRAMIETNDDPFDDTWNGDVDQGLEDMVRDAFDVSPDADDWGWSIGHSFVPARRWDEEVAAVHVSVHYVDEPGQHVRSLLEIEQDL